MTVGRLAHYAAKCSIQIVPLRAPVYAVTAEHAYRFSRGITDGIALEKSPPVESWGKSAIGLAGMIVFAVAATFLALVVAP